MFRTEQFTGRWLTGSFERYQRFEGLAKSLTAPPIWVWCKMEAHLGEVEGGLADSFGDTLTGTGVKTLEHFPLPGSREEQVAACNPSNRPSIP